MAGLRYMQANRGCALVHCRECAVLTHEDNIESCDDCFVYLSKMRNRHSVRLQIIPKLEKCIHSFGKPDQAYMEKLRQEFKRFIDIGAYSNGAYTDSGLYGQGLGFCENVMERIRKKARDLGYLTENEKDDFEMTCRLKK